jgi:hypothetical protein
MIVNRVFITLIMSSILSACVVTDNTADTHEPERASSSCIVGNDWYVLGYNAYLAHSRLLCENDQRVAQGLPVKAIDVDLPSPPEGKSWSKRLAYQEYQKNKLTVEQLGQLYASLEYVYKSRILDAKARLENSLISKPVYQILIEEAKAAWEG